MKKMTTVIPKMTTMTKMTTITMTVRDGADQGGLRKGIWMNRRRGVRSGEGDEPAPRRQKRRRQWKIIMEDIDSWQKYSFIFYETVGIGRGKDGSMFEKYLSLPNDVRVSKVHCVIIHHGDKLYLKDEDSRNGTFLNGKRIDRPIVIQKDDVIGVGETRLEIQRILRESE